MLVLVISLLIIAFFVLIASFTYRPTTSTPTPIVTGNNSSTTNDTTTATSSLPVIITKPTPPPAVADGHFIGIAGGGNLSKISSTTLNQELDQMVSLGIKSVRFDIEWGDVQYGSSNTFTWSNYDKLVNALAAHHLQGLGVILFTPGWARTPGCTNGVECAPQDPSTFATFAAEVAARYKGDGIHDWEIWNETNNYNFWAPKTDCNAYTALLKVTYPAIKKADPNAVVITGGFAPDTTDTHNTSPTEFLACIYKAGGEPYFDAVGDHPYSFPQMPSAVTAGAWAQMSITTPSLRSIMVANGDANKKIWVTEFGVPTNGPDSNWYLSESQQATMVTDAMSLYKTYTWAGPFFWYTLKDGGTTTDTNENFFGLTRADGSFKPAYTTLQSIIFRGL